MNNLNILQNFNKKFYYSDPYPYFVIDRCFSDKVYEMLYKDYNLIINYLKKNNDFKVLNNVRLQISSENFLKENIFKESIWYDFIEYHTSLKFLQDLVNIFEKDLKKYYPNIFLSLTNDQNEKEFLKIRNIEKDKSKFVIDCQPGINTPVYDKSKIRGPHVDNPVEIFGGLFYLRDDNDISQGGDLEIYDKEGKKIFFEGKAEVKNIDCLKKVKLYEYGKNKCVFFLNSKNTIHGVSERSKTPYTRNLTNFIIETYFHDKLFKLKRPGFKNFLKSFFNK